MQANLEAANTDRQALENSKAGTARTHAAALEQLKQSITSTKERLEEAQSSVAALQAELQVAPPPSRCRPSDPNSHWRFNCADAQGKRR
jgi:multidrug resistance efflux pump